MKEVFFHKEFLNKLEELIQFMDQSHTNSEREDEEASVQALKFPHSSPVQILNLANKIQQLNNKLEIIQSSLKPLLAKNDLKTGEIISEIPFHQKTVNNETKQNQNESKNLINEVKNLSNCPKNSAEEIKTMEGKIAKKKAPKAVLMTHMEIKKNYLSMILEIINSSHFKVDHNLYRHLAINSFDFLPYISQKLTSSISTYKDINLELLSFCWKLMSFPKSNITFTESQKMVGVPDVLPFRYGNEGPLCKNNPKNNLKKTVMVKKGVFSFHEDSVHLEIVRLLKKIHNTSMKQLVMLAGKKEDKISEPAIVSVKEMYKECRNTLNSKLHMYKINFLSFLMLMHLEHPKFEMILFKTREVKADYFERQMEIEHIKQWEAKTLSNI